MGVAREPAARGVDPSRDSPDRSRGVYADVVCDVLLVCHPQGSPAASWPAATAADAPSHQRHFSVSFAVMNNYQAAAAAAQGFGPPASPHAANTRAGFPPANSPGPTIDMYSSSAADTVAGYVQATSPQPSGFPAIAVSRAPLNYSPVSDGDVRTM